MKRSLLPLIMAGSILALSGCAGGGGETTVSDPAESGSETGVSQSSGEGNEEQKEAVYEPLVIGTEALSGVYNPFFSVSEGDEILSGLINVKLLETDRQGRIVYKGIEGETRYYNGSDYQYSGIADCEVKENEDGSTVYSFTLRDDVCFSDGEKLTADDVIFTYYVLCDPSYDGNGSLSKLPIKGLEAYRGGSKMLLDILVEKGEENTDFELYSETEQKTFFETDLPKAGEEFAKSIADHCVEKGFVTGIEKIDSNTIANAMANWGYAFVNDDQSITSTVSKTKWTMEEGDGPEAADFFEEMMLNYKGNIRKLSDAEKAGSDLMDFLPDKYKNTIDTAESAEAVEGIVKTGDYSFEITLDTPDISDLYTLNCDIMPLHIYGDADKYDPDSFCFGFTKGDISGIRAAAEPVGAGPYVFTGYEDGEYLLKANENYYKGKPLTAEIKLCAVSADEMVEAVTDGRVDIVCSRPDEEISDELAKATGILSYKKDAASYGYIGMNVQRVKVGSDPLSAESVNYRKAILTVLSAYREEAVKGYYGESARLCEYPVSDINWLVSEEAASYRAYTTDNSGREIYSDNATEEKRTEDALKAALKYFELAGFGVSGGKLTSAPEGMELKLEAFISGRGEGDHPSMDILTKSAAALKKIGFELKVTDLDDSYMLWTDIEGGLADLWCAAWPSDIYPDIFDVYHSEGRNAYMYRLYDKELDGLINEAMGETEPDKQPEAYKNCLDHILGLAVELPVYRRQGYYLFSVKKVDGTTLPAEMTPYYDYLRQIESLQIKPSTL